MFNQDMTEDKEAPKVIEVPLKNSDSIFKVKREDPYGFFKIYYERGVVPRKLSGQYTSLRDAKRGIEEYDNLLKQQSISKTTIKANKANGVLVD